MRNGSYFNTAENLNKIPAVVRFTLYNPTSTGVMITPQYSTNNGQSWKGLDYPYQFYAAAGATVQVNIANLPTNVPIMLRLKQTSGSSSEYCFIDDIEISYEATWEPEEPEYILGDVNMSGDVSIADVTALINYLLSGDDTNTDLLAADVNKDEKVSIADVTALINLLLGDDNNQ